MPPRSRAHGNSFVERNRSWLTWLHLRVLFAIEHCRTAALGGHLDRCRQCGHEAISFNSCRSRHCPKCQTNARDKWLAARSQELLPVKYVHVVFTIPHELREFMPAPHRLPVRRMKTRYPKLMKIISHGRVYVRIPDPTSTLGGRVTATIVSPLRLDKEGEGSVTCGAAMSACETGRYPGYSAVPEIPA